MKEQMRRLGDRFATMRTRVSERFADVGPRGRTTLRRIAVVLGVLVLLGYPIGMMWVHVVDDDADFQPSAAFAVEGGSRAVATAAALVEREAARWTPNDPFWSPGAALDNMPNYQLGLVYAISRFTAEMGDQFGRTRGSSAIDPDLDRAAGLLRYDGRIWYWGGGSFVPMQPAETQYRKAVAALTSYNRRLAGGTAVFDRRADNLIGLLAHIAADLGSSSAALDARSAASNAGWFDFQADDLFYNVKGRLYGYYLLLRDIGIDFEAVIREKQATNIWDQMLASLRAAAVMDPLIVANGAPDGFLIPSHLSAQGFYLLRARTQLRETVDSLIK